MIRYLSSVRVKRRNEYLTAIENAAATAFAEIANRDAIVTSVDDGVHGRNGARTQHGSSQAEDFRTWHTRDERYQWVTPDQAKRVVARMKQLLGPNYDVVLLGPDQGYAPHIHAEHDPKVCLV